MGNTRTAAAFMAGAGAATTSAAALRILPAGQRAPAIADRPATQVSLTAAAPRRRRDNPGTGAPRPCPRRHPPITGRRRGAAATGIALRRRPQGPAAVIWNRPGRGYLGQRSVIAARPGLPGAAVAPRSPGRGYLEPPPLIAAPPVPRRSSPPSAPRARPVPPRRQSPRARPPAPRVAGPPQRRWRSQWARRAAGDDTRAAAGAGGKSRVSRQRAGKVRRGGVRALQAPSAGAPSEVCGQPGGGTGDGRGWNGC